jgi:hypothetical protein
MEPPQLPMMRFGIGGYAVIEHGGDELSDWQHIKAVLPTKRAATTYARREIGTFSLTDALCPTTRLERGPRRGQILVFLGRVGILPSAVCTASRVALITGRYQYRLAVGLEEPLTGRETRKVGLPPEHSTLPSLSADRRLHGPTAAKCGAVGRARAVVSHPQRSTATLSARPAARTAHSTQPRLNRNPRLSHPTPTSGHPSQLPDLG